MFKRAEPTLYAVVGFAALVVLTADGNLLRRVPIGFDSATLSATLRG